MNRRAQVLYKDTPAGILSETDEGYEFYYLPEWLHHEHAMPISLTLPLSIEPYVSKTLFPFFDGLIPEGWLLEIAIQTWKINQRDRMGILLATGKDCIGAVSIIPEVD